MLQIGIPLNETARKNLEFLHGRLKEQEDRMTNLNSQGRGGREIETQLVTTPQIDEGQKTELLLTTEG